jgi:hypothetical protein
MFSKDMNEASVRGVPERGRVFADRRLQVFGGFTLVLFIEEQLRGGLSLGRRVGRGQRSSLGIYACGAYA